MNRRPESRARHPRLLEVPCACASLRRAARAVTQLYDEAMRPQGLHATQFTLLKTLASQGPVQQGVLGEMLTLDSTTLTRTLAPLRHKGWIVIRPGDEDRRERMVTLTAAGRRQVARAEAGWARAQKRLRQTVGEGDWKELLALTYRVTGAALRV